MTSISRHTLWPAFAALYLFTCGPSDALAQATSPALELTVSAGDHDRRDTPVRVAVDAPQAWAEVVAVELTTEDGQKIVGQLTAPGLLAASAREHDETIRRELHFILPSLDAGKTLTLTATAASGGSASGGFHWHDEEGRYAELRLDDQPVLRYMHQALDESSPEAREQTYKVFHHLFDPASGRLVTKGPGGLYPHHRGLFYGFNRISYDDGKKADTWHCRGDAHLSHEEFLSEEAGPVVGRHRVGVDWHGPGKEVFANEEREMTVYRLPTGVMVEFASRLSSAGPKIQLDGDPQHAGFQFRAANEVAETTNKETYYLRPTGRGEPGETRNWPQSTEMVDLAWNAMSFVLEGQRYTAVYVDRPGNPKEARFSERDYGRFGSYFEYELTPVAPLDLNYRLWLQPGEITGDDAAALSAEFVEPVTVDVTAK